MQPQHNPGFQTRSQNYEKRRSASSCMSVRMEQLGSNWTNFNEILYEYFFFKSVYKIQVSLKFGNNNGCLTRTSIHIFDQISSTSSYNEKCFRNKLQSKSKHAFYVQKNFFSPENLAFFFEMM